MMSEVDKYEYKTPPNCSKKRGVRFDERYNTVLYFYINEECKFRSTKKYRQILRCSSPRRTYSNKRKMRNKFEQPVCKRKIMF